MLVIMFTSLKLLTLAYLFESVKGSALGARNVPGTTEHVFPLMRRNVAHGSKLSLLPGIANLTRVGGGLAFSTEVSLGQEVCFRTVFSCKTDADIS